MTIHRLATIALSLVLMTGSVALAHEAAKGRNGGLRVDAGAYHAELLVDGTANVAVFLSDADDKPIPAKDFKANAILVIDGKSQRFPLDPRRRLETRWHSAGTRQARRQRRHPAHRSGWRDRSGQVLIQTPKTSWR